jgi:hypothetical protein
VLEVAAEDEHAVVGQQAGAAPFAGPPARRRTAPACRRWRSRAAHGVAAEARDHVVEGRDVAAQAGQAGGEGRMRVQDGAGFRAGGVDVVVEAPFGRGLRGARQRAVSRMTTMSSSGSVVVVHAARGDQEAVPPFLAGAHAEVAGGAALSRAGGHRARSGRAAAGASLQAWPSLRVKVAQAVGARPGRLPRSVMMR